MRWCPVQLVRSGQSQLAVASQAPCPPCLVIFSSRSLPSTPGCVTDASSSSSRLRPRAQTDGGGAPARRANEFIADHFSAAAFSDARWAFPTAPTVPVTCNGGMRMPSWFDIHDAPITSKSVRDGEDVLRAVQIVYTMIDKEIEAGTDPGNVLVFGLSQGGALSIASVLLYPKTLGGCAVFSGFLPFDSSFAARVTDEAKKTPVLWIHGGADSLIPVQEGRDGAKFLRGLGMTCEFKEYDRLGHTLVPYELEHCERWASESALGEAEAEHGRQGPVEKKGGRPGTATRRKSNLFCGVLNLFSK